VFAFGSTNTSSAFVDGAAHYVPANIYPLGLLVRSNSTTLAATYPGTNAPVYPGSWTHIIEFRSSVAGSVFWRDGAKVSTGGTDVGHKYSFAATVRRITTAGENASITLGDKPSTKQSFLGYIDNVRIYNSATATNNIAWLYQNTHPTNNLEAR
jgi:hypothetical protein